MIDDYDSIARKELVTAARERAVTRVAKLKTEHKDLKLRFEMVKSQGQQNARNDLLSTTTSSSQTPYSNPSSITRRSSTHPNGAPSPILESPFASSSSSSLYQPNHPPSSREDFALREHTFLQESENSLDQYIAQGRLVLEDLVGQRGLLKGTKTRLLDAANTLGVSRETIGWVERRTKQDVWIFGAGATFTLFSFWMIWHYLG